MLYRNIADVLKAVSARKDPKTVAVAAAEGDAVLEAVLRARRDGFVEPLLVGNKKKILGFLEQLTLSVEDDRIIDSEDPVQSARLAVELVRKGKADFLMKGKLNTADLLRAVLDKETGLTKGKVVTHMTFVELPAYHKLLVLNDTAILPYPTLEQKVAQLQTVTAALRNVGYGDELKVAEICAAEESNPKIVESADAIELKKMHERGELSGFVFESPISLDIALSTDIARKKDFSSPVAGDADLLHFPNLISGNTFVKTIMMYGGATTAGVVLGASAPISMSSRAANADTRYHSLVLASATVQRR